MRLKIWFVALALLSLSACRKAPHYRLCTMINDGTNPLYLYCESTNPKQVAYTIWMDQAERESYLAMPLDDYKAILKYTKQAKKDLARCRR